MGNEGIPAAFTIIRSTLRPTPHLVYSVVKVFKGIEV